MASSVARRLTLPLIAVAAVGVVALLFTSSRIQMLCCAAEWRRFPEPGGDHVIVVYRLPQWFALPGASSDAPGVVRLIKPVDGEDNVEQSTDVAMVQDVSEPEWTSDRVTIKLVADWPLSH